MTEVLAKTTAPPTRTIVRGREEAAPDVQRSIEEERRHRKERLAGAFRMLAMFGMNHGVAGHITARDPERTDCFWVNPLFKHFATMTVSDLLLVDDQGQVVEGAGVLNNAAFAIHSRIHRARPDVVAAAHAHSTYGQIWSTTGRLLDPLTQDACAFYRSHGVFADYTGVVLDVAEGDRIAGALGEGKAVVLQNHGLLTVGGSVEEAAWWFIAMEQACEVQVMAEAIGKPIQIDPAMAELTAAQTGTPIVGQVQFDYQWQRVIKDGDDFLN